MLVWLPHTRLLPCWSNGFSFWGFVRVLSLMPNRFTHDGRVRFWDRVRTDGLLTVGVESARRAWFRRMTAIDLTGQVRFRVAQRAARCARRPGPPRSSYIPSVLGIESATGRSGASVCAYWPCCSWRSVRQVGMRCGIQMPSMALCPWAPSRMLRLTPFW